jgi:hypothetical protein
VGVTTPLDLDALLALRSRGTPGTWRAVLEGKQPVCYYRALLCFAADEGGAGYVSVVTDDATRVRAHAANAELAAAAVNALPALVGRVREAERERDATRAVVEAARALCKANPEIYLAHDAHLLDLLDDALDALDAAGGKASK